MATSTIHDCRCVLSSSEDEKGDIMAESKKKAYALFESGLLATLEPGTIKCLQQIHAYIFGGLHDFASTPVIQNSRPSEKSRRNCV